MRPLSALSKEYLLIAVEGRDDNGIVDPTSFAASVAFLAVDAVPTGATTWYAGSWVSVVSPNVSTIYKIKLLVGPGGAVTLTAGSYDVWIKVAATFETPQKFAGTILVV